jgi:response regulator RpfG family c-di-GMP phosphodiesterase
MSGPRILLVDDHEARRGDLAFALESTHGFLVEQAGTQRAAAERLAGPPLDALLIMASLPDGDAIPLLQQVSHNAPDAPVSVVVAAPDEGGLRRLSWAEGATAVLTTPVDSSELSAALHAALRRRADRMQSAAARDRLAASMDRLTDLLVLILDAAVPGASRRGAEVANLASLLARGFDLGPAMLDELRQAARLHEVGRFAMGRRSNGPAAARLIPAASSRLLSEVPYLQEIADLVEGVGANWDGSGIPPGRQRGQIPLRSRLLRVAVDLLTELERPGRPAGPSLAFAAASLIPESGRWYDPAAIAVLEALVADEETPSWQEPLAWVYYDGLTEGMELATDLHTVSGIKLLSSGSVLNSSTLELVRNRHQIDPLALPVSVHRQRTRPLRGPWGREGAA